MDSWCFVRFRGSQDNAERKPEPTLARKLAVEMDRHPADVIFVGDSSVDIMTARNAGMIPVAVTWGYRPRSELESAAPTHWVDHPTQLIELFT